MKKEDFIKILVAAILVVTVFGFGVARAQLDPNDVVLALSFDDGQGETAKDSSDKGNDGELVGPKWVNDGKFGSALAFDGSDDFVEVRDHDSLNFEEAFTVMLWINFESIAGEHNLIQKLELVGAPQHLGWFVTKLPHNVFRWSIKGDAMRDDFDIPQFDIEEKTWHQMVAMYDGDSMKFYWNNELKGERESPNKKHQTGPDPVKIGTRGQGGQTFFTKGIIDEVMIVIRSLNEDEIEQHFNGGNEEMLAVQPQGKLTATWGTIKAWRTR